METWKQKQGWGRTKGKREKMKGRKDGREKHMAKEEEMKDRCIERRSLEKGEGKRNGKEEGKQTARTHGRCCAYIFT